MKTCIYTKVSLIAAIGAFAACKSPSNASITADIGGVNRDRDSAYVIWHEQSTGVHYGNCNITQSIGTKANRHCEGGTMTQLQKPIPFKTYLDRLREAIVSKRLGDAPANQDELLRKLPVLCGEISAAKDMLENRGLTATRMGQLEKLIKDNSATIEQISRTMTDEESKMFVELSYHLAKGDDRTYYERVNDKEYELAPLPFTRFPDPQVAVEEKPVETPAVEPKPEAPKAPKVPCVVVRNLDLAWKGFEIYQAAAAVKKANAVHIKAAELRDLWNGRKGICTDTEWREKLPQDTAERYEHTRTAFVDLNASIVDANMAAAKANKSRSREDEADYVAAVERCETKMLLAASSWNRFEALLPR